MNLLTWLVLSDSLVVTDREVEFVQISQPSPREIFRSVSDSFFSFWISHWKVIVIIWPKFEMVAEGKWEDFVSKLSAWFDL